MNWKRKDLCPPQIGTLSIINPLNLSAQWQHNLQLNLYWKGRGRLQKSWEIYNFIEDSSITHSHWEYRKTFYYYAKLNKINQAMYSLRNSGTRYEKTMKGNIQLRNYIMPVCIWPGGPIWLKGRYYLLGVTRFYLFSIIYYYPKRRYDSCWDPVYSAYCSLANSMGLRLFGTAHQPITGIEPML